MILGQETILITPICFNIRKGRILTHLFTYFDIINLRKQASMTERVIRSERELRKWIK